MLETNGIRASGFEVIGYGHGIKAEELALKACRDKSALMLPSALKEENVRKKLDELSSDMMIVVEGHLLILILIYGNVWGQTPSEET